MDGLGRQRTLHDDGVGLLHEAMAAQATGDHAAADASFARARAVFEQAVSLRFDRLPEKQAAAPLAAKMEAYLRMLSSPTNRGTHFDVNILDMRALPPRFQSVHAAYTACPGFEGRDVFDALQAAFGFQQSSVANQKEHVTLLLTNFCAHLSTPEEPATVEAAAAKFHTRLFGNYTKWCSFVGEKPRTSSSPLVDIVLFFLMWGEASNFRQTPELLCWLFHHLVQDVRRDHADAPFLEACITPMYLELAKEGDKKTPLGARAPHTEMRNYDDVNEFFWTKKCLKYSPATIAEALASVDKKGRPNVVTKTFLERRSWMRALLSFRRIFLTNILLFLATVAFALNMVFLCPDNPIMYTENVLRNASAFGKLYASAKPGLENSDERAYFMDTGSDMTETKCNVPKLATCLGIELITETTFGTLPPDFRSLISDVPFTHCLDLTSGRCTCYIDLLDTCFAQKGKATVYADGTDATLASEKSVIVYDNKNCLPKWRKAAMNAILLRGDGQLNCAACQWSLTTVLGAIPQFGQQLLDFNRKDMGPLMLLASGGCIGLLIVWQVFNRLFSAIGIGFVGRSLYVPLRVQCRYTCFWVFLFSVKLLFDYRFMVKSLVETSLFIYVSDPTEYLKVSYFMLQVPIYNFLYIAFLWAPAFLVFLYDAQIFYAIFSVLYGSVAGFNLKIGELRSFSVLRAAFGSIPKVFNRKMVPNLVEPPKDKKAKKTKKQAMRSDTDGPGPERHFKTIDANGASPLTIATHAYSALLEQDVLSDRATEVLSVDDVPLDERLERESSTSSSSNGSVKALDAVFGLTGAAYERSIPFAMAWNQCLVSMREADVLSNRELSVLSYLIDAQRLYTPVFLTAGKLDESINIVLECAAVFAKLEKDKKKTKALDKVQASMIARLSKDPLRLQAIFGSYIFTSKVLKLLIGDRHPELHSVFAFVEETILTQNVLKGLELSELHAVRSTCAQLMRAIQTTAAKAKTSPEAIDRGLPKVLELLQSLFALFKKVVRKQEHLVELLSGKAGTFMSASSEYPREQLSSLLHDEAAMDIVSRAYQLLTVDNVDAEPRSPEGQRRLRFFANSLFMAMPEAKPIEQMHSFSIATPYFNEIVLYSVDELTAENDDSIRLLYYLQTIHPVEWTAFLERIHATDTADALAKSPEEVQLWASYRGQTLARTVRGMMYHEDAIRFLAWLEVGENAPMHVRGCRCNRCVYLDEMVALKFSYVCTCQIYGQQKASRLQQALDIDVLLKRHPGFRVAYVDKSKAGVDGPVMYASVLLRAVGDLIVEVYRVQLPGNPIIGEGKPENQNHAVIFTRGEFVQAIDMNQDGYFEECLKMPNLLATVDDAKHSPKAPVTIIGFREYVFTGGVSNLANFMQIQELSFVSLGQRMLAMFHVRQHYGHPDVFDKMFAMTTGGTAKSSKGINLSEDIFAGFNSTLRGGRVTHEEFIQVGKGRDVGMQQLALFEAKLSSGAGECVTSRDAMRMASRLDFFRLQSWFYGNLGWYFTQTMTVFAIYAFIYGKMYFCLSGMDKFYLETGRMGISGVLNTSWALQFGFLLVVPVIAVVGVERGFRHGISYLLWNIMTLGPLFFTFQMGNRMHYFDRTLIHGGAKYRATGRGFTIKHEKFAELFRFYAFSHFYRGVELIALLLIWHSYGTFSWCNCSWTLDMSYYKGTQPLPAEWTKRCYASHYQACVAPTEQSYGVMSYSLWLVAATWLWSPFIFNPSGLDWDKVIEDYRDWQNWLQTKNDSSQSWLGWWTSEVSALEHSTPFARLVFVLRKTRFLFLAIGIYLHLMYRVVYSSRNASVATDAKTSSTLALLTPYIILGAFFVTLLVLVCCGYVANRVTKRWNKTFKQKRLRRFKFDLSMLTLTGFVFVLLFFIDMSDVLEGLLVLGILAYWFLQVMLGRLKHTHVIIETMAGAFDVAIGWIVFGPILFIAMFMPFLAAFQQRVMFNSAFTSGLEVAKLLSNDANKTKPKKRTD